MNDTSTVQRDDIVKTTQELIARCLEAPKEYAAPARNMQLLIISNGKNSVLYDAVSATRLGGVVRYRYEHDAHESPRLELELVVEPDDVHFVTYQAVEMDNHE